MNKPLPEEDAILYPSTSPSSVIQQLKENINKLEKIYNPQEKYVLDNLQEERQYFLKAQERWNYVQQTTKCNLNIIQGRKKEEKARLKTKILRYRILQKYGKEIWLRAFKLAEKYEDEPERLDCNDLEEGVSIEQQIAKDLLENKLGMWFSNEINIWKQILLGIDGN